MQLLTPRNFCDICLCFLAFPITPSLHKDSCCAPPQPSLIASDLSVFRPALSLAAMPNSWCTLNKIQLAVLILHKGLGIRLKGFWAFPSEAQKQSHAHLPCTPLGPLHTSAHNTHAQTQSHRFCSGKLLMQIRSCQQTPPASIPKMLDAITKPSNNGSDWQSFPMRPQMCLAPSQFCKLRLHCKLENQVLCVDLAPWNQKAHDSVDFWENSGSECPFPRPTRESCVLRAAGQLG